MCTRKSCNFDLFGLKKKFFFSLKHFDFLRVAELLLFARGKSYSFYNLSSYKYRIYRMKTLTPIINEQASRN